MMRPMRTLAVVSCAIALGAASPVKGAARCPRASLTLVQAADLQTRAFAALSKEDWDVWRAVATDDFTAHENGQAYDRDGFFKLIADAHRAGTGLRWSVTRPSVDSRCGLALIWYLNEGTVTRNGVHTCQVS